MTIAECCFFVRLRVYLQSFVVYSVHMETERDVRAVGSRVFVASCNRTSFEFVFVVLRGAFAITLDTTITVQHVFIDVLTSGHELRIARRERVQRTPV